MAQTFQTSKKKALSPPQKFNSEPQKVLFLATLEKPTTKPNQTNRSLPEIELSEEGVDET